MALAGLAACADDTTAPQSKEASAVSPQVAVNLNVAAGGSLDFSADLETIRDAVLPGFDVPSAADSLRVRLVSLTDALAAGDRTAAAATLAKARSGLTSDVSNATDLGYIEMVFANIDAALARQ
ncbi:MAG: hypothetical protein V4813_15400 [Gemmatimonadota bacterium]